MSGKSCTSGSMRSCAGSVRLGTASGHEYVLDALYERTKRDKKSVRVLTVIVYVFCVSLAAIMLSLYYVFFWEPKDAHYAQPKVSNTVEPPMSTTPMPTCFMPHTGRGNITINEVAKNVANSTIHDANATQTTDDAEESTETSDTNITSSSPYPSPTGSFATFDDSDAVHNDIT